MIVFSAFVVFLMLLSVLGFSLFFHKRYGIRIELAMAISASIIIFTVFWGGILNALRPAAIMVFLLGYIALFAAIRKMKKPEWKEIIKNQSLIFFAICCLTLFVRFRNQILYSYDDFSHWGTIVKCMLQNNRFPTNSDTYITFMSYPPGAACWMYYFCQFLGENEGMYLLAHGLLSLIFMMPIFTFAKRPEHIVLCCIAILLVYTNVVTPICLCVDVLLAASGVAAVLAVFIFDMDDIEQKLFLIPLLSCPILIKNSGIFFYFVSIAVFLSLSKKQKGTRLLTKKRARICIVSLIAIVVSIGIFYLIRPNVMYNLLKTLYHHRNAVIDALIAIALVAIMILYGQKKCSYPIKNIITVLAPILCLYFWQRHVLLVFPYGLHAKHSLSLTNVQQVLIGNKNYTHIKDIVTTTITWIVSFSKNKALLIVTGCVVVSSLKIICKTGSVRNQLKYLLYMLTCLFAYEIGIIVMYTCSMPYSEFVFQNGADYLRYNSTIVDFLICIMLCYYMYSANDPALARRNQIVSYIESAVILVLLLITLIPSTRLADIFVPAPSDIERKNHKLIEQIQTEEIPSGGNYLLYTSTADAGYSVYMMRYHFLSSDIHITNNLPSKDACRQYTAYIDWEHILE